MVFHVEKERTAKNGNSDGWHLVCDFWEEEIK